MRVLLLRCLLLGLLFAAAAAPARAANPRVTLKLESVTCEEALDALAQVSGVAIDLQGVPRSMRPPTGRGSGPIAKLSERASFQWSNAPLGGVIRELCGRYNLRFQQFNGQYMVLPGAPAAGAAAGKPRFLVERDGFRLYAVSVATSSERGLNLVTGENRSNGESLTVAFKVEWPGGEPEALIGFEGVAARDELGNVLQWRPPVANFPLPQLGSIYPDEWQGTVMLLGPQPRARKLAWLEGELMVYGVFQPQTLELSIADAKLPARGKLMGTDVEAVRIDPPRADAQSIQERGPTVITRFQAPVEEAAVFSDRSRQIHLDLVGASGKVYPGRAGNIAAQTRDGRSVREMETQFAPISEPVSKLIYRTIEKREPRRLVSFHFENIPIPPADILPPAVVLQPPFGVGKPVTGPFTEAGGVSLELRTELNGRPAPDGVLSVGLARREADGWSSVRWQETEVQLGGVSQIRNLRPGKYRLLRTYRPRVAVDPGGDGRWEGGEVELDAASGKAPTVPALRWVSSRSAPRPGNTANPKPAGKTPAPRPVPTRPHGR